MNNIFEKNYNEIVAHNYKKAHSQFIDNYYENPQQAEFLIGVIITHILLDEMKKCTDFLEKESQVSIISKLIDQILQFIKKNPIFNDLKKISVIFNIGLFLKRNNNLKLGKIFFRTCLTLEPKHKKALTVLGECEIRESNIQKGVRLFSAAAGS